ncbi:MAG: hypothetical protein ACJ8CR_28120, partial [Roseiflexaceae bacterium]
SAPRRPRFDPMTGEPADEAEIPINNVNPSGTPIDPRARRNRLLGIILLGVGAFILVGMIPGFGHFMGIAARFLFPLLLVGVGILMLRRHN